ncbi:hypothetical protein SFy_5456 [Shigella flexneri 2003036]|nr:hypothetical protein SFy_5456 [Shigella flexneri 2003036]
MGLKAHNGRFNITINFHAYLWFQREQCTQLFSPSQFYFS